MTREFWVLCYTYFRESGYQAIDWRRPSTPYPTPLAVAVALALRGWSHR